MTPFQERYDMLAERVGRSALQALVRHLVPSVRAALAADDEHLNTIPLVIWDRLAGSTWEPQRIPSCGPAFDADRHLLWRAPFTPDVANGLSLANRVCLLKHVAAEMAKEKEKS